MDWRELASARPYAFRFRPEATSLLLIDMQRDFLQPGGFGQIQCGNDQVFKRVREIVPKTSIALESARALGMHVIYTREGHKSDLSDLPHSKRLRQVSAPHGHHHAAIGDAGPMGKLLVRGEFGHGIIDEVKPLPGEVVIDKAGKGSFWNTTLHRALLARGITHLLIAGATTECCVSTTFREAADRGFECCVLSDCTSGYDQDLVAGALDTLCAFDGLFGYVASSEELGQIESAGDEPRRDHVNMQSDLSIASLHARYRSGAIKPTDVALAVAQHIKSYAVYDPAVWTYVRSSGELVQAARELEERYAGKPLPPLYGIPFGVKDNIDIAGVPTTAACQAYAYMPTKHATTVEALVRAGALFVGKTNMDQLATGLSGCRSPFGYPRSVYGNDRISGGSSSGSAVAVAAGIVSFSLATDTAGSGRVPAALNGIVGLKPTKGTISSVGLVPACRTLDTITVMASSVEEARNVWLVLDEGPDGLDPYAKPQQSLPLWHVDFRGPKLGGFRFGIPPQSALAVCDAVWVDMFAKAVSRLEQVGGVAEVVDWKPLQAASDLLYAASLVQERVACIGPDFIRRSLETFHPATRSIYQEALDKELRPWEVFQDLHMKTVLTHQVAQMFEQIDVLLVPTTPCHPTVAEMEAQPLGLNAKLGLFTHFGNVVDLCGVAVPAGMYRNNEKVEDLPFGVTLLGASGRDGMILDIAREFERAV